MLRTHLARYVLLAGAFAATLLTVVLVRGSSQQTTAATEIPVFDDVSAAAGLRTQNLTTFGMQWADYDNDGNMDFYVGRHGGCDPELYHSNSDGTFTDVSITSGIRVCGGDRHNCDWGDLNRDFLLDLFCAVQETDHVLMNQGNGTFLNRGAALGFGFDGGRSTSLVDADGDGDLDIVYGGINQVSLYRNNNNASSFTRVALGISTGSEGPRSQSVADYNADGTPDVFIAMYPHTTGLLLRGNGSSFVDATGQAGIPGNGAQAGTWGDYDNDGDLDLFVGNWRSTKNILPPALLENLGDGTFVDVTSPAQIADSRARMGLWGDFNDDGWLDLFVVNGQKKSDGVNQADQLYLNNGDKTFMLAGSTAGLNGPAVGSGDSAAWADYDNDGDLDILVGNGSGQLECSSDDVPKCQGLDKLYRNRGNSNHSLQVRLISNGDTYGYGSKLWLDTPAGTQYREMTDGLVGKSQNAQIVHFGLGLYDQVDQLRIRWPDGQEEIYTNLPATTAPVVIEQGSGVGPTPTPTPTQSATPNLTETTVKKPPASVARGQSFGSADTAKNVGSSQADASSTLYYLSTDNARSPDDTLVGGRAVASLAAGQQSWEAVTLAVTSNTPLGSYYIIACADANAEVDELNESDNCRASAAKVQVTP